MACSGESLNLCTTSVMWIFIIDFCRYPAIGWKTGAVACVQVRKVGRESRAAKQFLWRGRAGALGKAALVRWRAWARLQTRLLPGPSPEWGVVHCVRNSPGGPLIFTLLQGSDSSGFSLVPGSHVLTFRDVEQETRGSAGLALSSISSRLWVAPGHAVYIGPSLQLDTHVGSVACLVLGLDGTFDVDVAGSTVAGIRSALIPPRIPHKITAAAGQAMAFGYLDPATASVEACRARMKEWHPIAVEHRDEETLRTAGGNELIEAATGSRTPFPADQRIVAATRALHSPGGIETKAATLASEAGLSLSRFLHLFVAQTGTGVRCYRRWARMILVAEVIAGGGDLTRAAADAGFATPSHFSVAFRRMFGLTPSRLLGTGVEIRTAVR